MSNHCQYDVPAKNKIKKCLEIFQLQWLNHVFVHNSSHPWKFVLDGTLDGKLEGKFDGTLGM